MKAKIFILIFALFLFTLNNQETEAFTSGIGNPVSKHERYRRDLFLRELLDEKVYF